MKPTLVVSAGFVIAAVLGGLVVYRIDARDPHSASLSTDKLSRHALFPVAATGEETRFSVEIARATAPVPPTAPLDAPITVEEIAEVLTDPEFVARLPVAEIAPAAPTDATTSGTVLSDGTMLPASGGIVIAADGKIAAAGSTGVSIAEDGRIISLPAGGYTVARDGTVTPRPATNGRETN